MQKVKNWHFKIIKAFVVVIRFPLQGFERNNKEKKVHHDLFPRAALMFDDRQKTVST